MTSMTDFSFKLTHIYIIKVSFLLENRNRNGAGKQVNGQTGRGGVVVESNLYLNYYAYKLHQQSTDVLKKCGMVMISTCFVYTKHSDNCEVFHT